jgi:hypothetical protein
MGPWIIVDERCEPQDERAPNLCRQRENERNPRSDGRLRAHGYYTFTARDYTSTIANA